MNTTREDKSVARQVWQYGRRRVLRLIRDDNGQDLIEYALLTAIVAVGWLLVGTPIKGRMKNAYLNRTAQADAISATPAPTP